MDFSSSKVQKQDRPKFSLLHLLFLNSISLFFIIIFSIVFFIYTIILNIYLKLKIGKSYGGVVPPRDLIFFLPDVSVCHITTVAYARCDKKIDMVKRVKEIIQEKIFDFPDNYPKLTSSTHSFHGYYFTKKYDCNVNDVVKEIHLDKNKELTEEFLKKYTAKVTNAEFGKNGSVLWDIHVGPCPIKETQNGVYRYPIISRFHHSIADGTSLVNLIIHVFGDKGCENYGKKIFEKVLKKQSSGKQRKSFSEWVEANVVNLIKMTSVYMELLFVSAGKYVAKSHLRSQDVNALHGKLLTGEKLCAWVAEDTVECIPMVKRIKNKTKTQFMCVVSTAVAASLSNYFKRNDLPIPEDMSGLIAVLLDYPDVDTTKPVALKNKAGAVFFDTPMTYGSITLVEALKNVSKEWERQIGLADALVGTILVRLLGLIPPILLVKHLEWKFSYILTNVPGGSTINTRDGWIFEKVIPIAPNVLLAGVSIAILSYDEKFNIGVLIDKALVKSQEEVQMIADDILISIKSLDHQLEK